MNDSHPRRRVTRARILYRRRPRQNVIVEVVEEKFWHAARLPRCSIFVQWPSLSSSSPTMSRQQHRLYALLSNIHAARGSDSRVQVYVTLRYRVLARSVARSSICARARRRVTRVKFQAGIWVKTSPPRNARRNADTRERRTETERTRNGERQRRERGRESDSPVSPPSLPGERLWRRPGSHCCFPRRGVTRGGWWGDTIISQHPLARRTNPHGTGAWRRRRVCVSWWEIARERKRERNRAWKGWWIKTENDWRKKTWRKEWRWKETLTRVWDGGRKIMAEGIGETEMDAQWLERDDERSRKWRDGGESDERGKAKKCVLKRDKDKATAGKRW